MANDFSKEERVAFEEILEGFEDALVLSNLVSKYSTDSTTMERSQNTIWRPQPYVAQSFNGTDQTANFSDSTQLSVPAQINISKSVPWIMSANDLNDSLQEGRLGDAAKKKLASDINVSIMNTASNEGTLVVKRTTAASGFDDVAECDAIMNERGVQMFDRKLALSTRDYNGMADNLGSRTLGNSPKSLNAYEKAFVGDVAGFSTYKLDYANSLTAAAGTTVTVNGANQYYTPTALTTSNGAQSNTDNRYQDIALTVGGGTMAAGDCFTIAGVFSVHNETKQATDQLMTFRVIDLLASAGATGTMRISPPIISNGGGTDAEAQYQNVSATPATGAALVFLNTDTASVNPFWYKGALEILPGRYAVPSDAGAGVLRSSTSQGFELVMQKQYDINTMKTKYRLDTFYGVVNLQPEMSGIMLFGQSS
jgi:hypothetical protein